ncbi:conserved hypothetical protein [Vibrio chagasii]|nr:conserved hypothetical protein [Vibrio chagasii]CAH6939750.1 conserved hypothetical protein [Vibrio chagasii]
MSVNLVQEKSRFLRYFSNLKDFQYDNMQFSSNIPAGCINVTIAPLEHKSLMLTYRSSREKYAMIAIQDGVFDLSNALKNKKHVYPLHMPMVNDFLFCLGEHEKKLLRELNPSKSVYSYQPKFLSELIDLKMENNKKKFDFLITTANTAYFDDFEFNELITLLVNIILELDKNEHNYILRIYDPEIISYLEDKVGRKLVNITTGDFKSVVNNVECVLTTPSTIAVESMLLNKPVGTLYYRDEPLLTQTGWIIHRSSNLPSVVSQMVLKDDDRMLIQSALLKNYIDVDYTALNADKIDEICKPALINEVIESASAEMLHSKFNFNLKYFFKRIHSKVFR